MLKKILACMIALFVLASVAEGAQRVRGYIKKNGTYVMPHYKTKAEIVCLEAFMELKRQ